MHCRLSGCACIVASTGLHAYIVCCIQIPTYLPCTYGKAHHCCLLSVCVQAVASSSCFTSMLYTVSSCQIQPSAPPLSCLSRCNALAPASTVCLIIFTTCPPLGNKSVAAAVTRPFWCSAWLSAAFRHHALSSLTAGRNAKVCQ